MIDVTQEDLITLPRAAALLPPQPNGKRIHVSTIYRWIAAGVRGGRLEAVVLGGRTLTSKQAVQRFAERLTAAYGPESAMHTIRSSAARERAVERAEKALMEAGI